MKVAMVIPGVDRLAGAERQVILLAKGLASRGWAVTVIALTGSGGDAKHELLDAGVGFLSLAMQKGFVDPRGWIRYHRWLVQNTPDVVHAHLPHATWLARGSHVFTPVRALVDTVHTCAVGPRYRRWAYRLTSRIPDRTSTVSRATAESYLAAGMFDPERVVVIPNAVDEQKFKPDAAKRAQARAALGITHEFLWASAARLEPVKDYTVLLRGFAELPKPAVLAIAGEGSREAELRSLCTALGLEGRVRFLGFQSDMRPLLHAADGFVLCSKWEGLPLSLLEAGACAVPCVSSDIPAAREILTDHVTGFLAQQGSPSALRDAMLTLMELPQRERAAMGVRARSKVMECFSISRVLDQWETLYGELLHISSERAERRLAGLNSYLQSNHR